MTGRSFVLIGALLVVLTAPGCSLNPATGEPIFTAFMPESSEAAIGAERHPEILARFGGAYRDTALAAYVSDVGARVAGASDLPDLDYTFTVLDSSLVNAFSLPGGYVYVTRGALAVADDEAELAAVLAHEIGHVAARHSAQRYSSRVLAEVTLGLGNLASAGLARDSLAEAAGSVLASFSREDEMEADQLAVRYLERAGYDPRAVATMLSRLAAYNRITEKIRGGAAEAQAFDMVASHPSDDARLTRARNLAAAEGDADVRDRTRYRAEIDGLVIGPTAEQGLVRGRTFVHPVAGFVFTVPEGFELENRLRYVAGRGPEESVLVFKPAFQEIDDPARYLTEDWGRAIDFDQVEPLQIDGLPAALGAVRVETEVGARHVTLAAIRWDETTVHRFIFISTPQRIAVLGPEVRRTITGFHRLTPREAARYKERRLGFHTVRQGETAARIAARMPLAEHALPIFRALNGLGAESRLETGDVVKIVEE